jgi:hypothetical protein
LRLGDDACRLVSCVEDLSADSTRAIRESRCRRQCLCDGIRHMPFDNARAGEAHVVVAPRLRLTQSSRRLGRTRRRARSLIEVSSDRSRPSHHESLQRAQKRVLGARRSEAPSRAHQAPHPPPQLRRRTRRMGKPKAGCALPRLPGTRFGSELGSRALTTGRRCCRRGQHRLRRNSSSTS